MSQLGYSSSIAASRLAEQTSFSGIKFIDDRFSHHTVSNDAVAECQNMTRLNKGTYTVCCAGFE